MKKIAKKFLALTMVLVMLASYLPNSMADYDSTNNVEQSTEAVVNDEAQSEGDSENIEVKLGVGKITEDGNVVEDTNKDLSADELSVESKLNANYAKSAANVSSIYGADRYQTAVQVSKSGWPNGSDSVVVVNSKNVMIGLIATPYATMLNAPILVTNTNSLDSNVSNELKRLKPKKVYIIGDRDLVSKSVADKMKSVTGATIERVFGSQPGELSASVAERIAAARNVDTAYVVSGSNGAADALSIASKAGETKNPVIVVDKNSINVNAYSFLGSKVNNAYYIGGADSISNSLINKISGVVKNGTTSNRVSGNDRHATNIAVINKFYKDTNLSSLVVTKSSNNDLIDTVTAGPFATKKNAPILITSKTSVASVTSEYLNKVQANNVYQVGGGISSSVMNKIKSLLDSSSSTVDDTTTPPVSTNPNVPENSNIKGKTIVIDPGHGGKDSGSVGLNGIKEKDWTLITALACADYLTKAGANVIMTRKTDTYPSLEDRAVLSNKNKAVFFCSIHYNKGGDVVNSATGEQSGTGVEVFRGEGALANKASNNVINSILEKFNLRNRGSKDGTHLYVVRNTDAPAILVEGGFISNSKDVNMLNSESALKTMGIQIAKGIVASF
ncbi:N-acetylmuramoyl-L-alanine amidase [Peptostreptococcus faecalis]|uniref:N-acetylmuramoyl-L-alanine amidase n=1 Tax=Peptostreptococcus faecalis TaxID=2045015 RepID=UPI000C7BB612|nr:N-acetylmuramoyl-L-alanine amidase [Peptostreptococcus faecalis]